MKKLFYILVGLLVVMPVFADEQLLVFDFANVSGKAKDWLKKNEFKDQKGFGRFPFETKFEKNRLYIIHKKKNFGLYGKKVKINGATRLRITWGIDKFFTKGDNWIAAEQKIPIHVTLSFGEEKIDSGSAVVPNLPYFISFILSKNADNSKFYKGKYFQKGGRYYCASCPIKEKQTIVTEIDLLSTLKETYGLQNVPVITLISFGADSRETSLDAIAFIEKIEILN